MMKRLISIIRGAGFEDEHDVNEYLDAPNTTRLQIVIGVAAIAIIAIVVGALVS